MVPKFKICLAVGLLSLLSSTIWAQSFQYLLPTSLSEIDDLQYDAAAAQLGLYAVKSKDKWGVKNKENVLLVPAMYDSLRIDTEAGMITCFHQRTVSNLGYNGRKLSYQEVDSLFQKRDRKRWLALAKKIQQQYKELLPGFDLTYTEKSLPEVTLKDASGKVIDSIRLQNYTQVYHSAAGYRFINGSMYNKMGEKLKPDNKYSQLIPSSTGFILAKQAGFWGLLNAHGKPLLPCVYTSIDTLEGLPLFLLGRNNQYYLADSINKRIVPHAVERVLQPGAKGHVVFYFTNKTLSYDATTKNIVQWDFVIDKKLGKTGYWLVKKFGFTGCVDLNTGEEIIPAKYEAIWEAGDGYIVASSGKKNNGLMKAMDVYHDYKLVYQSNLIQFLPFSEGLLIESDSKRCVLDNHFKEKWCLERGTFYPASMGRLISAYSDESGPGVYLAKDFANRNFKKPYETAIDLKQPLTVNGKPGLWVRYAKSWGVIDYEGNPLINFQWDEMKDIKTEAQQFKVKKDGKWGVIRVI
ncbi:MAG: WG repeat-containing protein [Saprospiraceae bacterium]|nr:WG repeat-containing protein [Saprospiraceae bacterium]MBK8851405.1 WG repeat-containing protein [Saprospiraceae bacterium]